MSGWTYPEDTPLISDEERRGLRERAVAHAAYMHGDENIVFERAECVRTMLQTAQEIYDWIIKEEPTVDGVEQQQAEVGSG
jgi:hypothetical protein